MGRRALSARRRCAQLSRSQHRGRLVVGRSRTANGPSAAIPCDHEKTTFVHRRWLNSQGGVEVDQRLTRVCQDTNRSLCVRHEAVNPDATRCRP